MEEKECVLLVTEDRWIKEEGGILDISDREILEAASRKGRVRVRVVNMLEMLETMEKTEPEKFQRFQENMEKQAGKRLTRDDLVELGQRADDTMQGFSEVASNMTLGQATQVRHWRVHKHMTWRRLARAAYSEKLFGRAWMPPSNQIMGMVLCQKAALIFEENFRETPWN